MINLMKNIAQKTLLRSIRFILLGPLTIAILAACHLLSLIKPVKLLHLTESRIGEFGARTDLFLRQLKSGKGDKPTGFWLAIAGDFVCNEQLLKMFRRHLPIIHSKYASYLLNHKRIKKSKFFLRLPMPESAEEYDHFKIGPIISFTRAEEDQGEHLLRELGIPEGGWFVCFYARDSAYLAGRHPNKSFQSSEWRNSSIENTKDAMQYVTSLGGYAVRMGAAVSKPLDNAGDPRIIDYATKHRSDFGDIFLMAKCKFCVAGSSGLLVVSNIFGVPVVKTNMTPYYHGAWGAKDLFMFKLHWSSEKQRVLTLEEILGTGVAGFHWGHHFEEAGIELIENSSDDMLNATIEMNQRVDGLFQLEEGDNEAQQHFRSLLRPWHNIYNSPTQMSTSYMRAHPEILSYESVA